MPDNLNPPEFNLEQTLNSTGHSEDLIRRLVTEGVHSEEIHNTIQRNTGHIRIVLGREQVASSNSLRLADFLEAAELGEAFIAE
jgi:hypothetical protein